MGNNENNFAIQWWGWGRHAYLLIVSPLGSERPNSREHCGKRDTLHGTTDEQERKTGLEL